MRARAIGWAVALAAVGWVGPWTVGGSGASQAAASTLQTDFPCYLQDKSVHLTGSGFTPGAPYTVALNAANLGPGTVKPDGTVTGTFSSGRLPPATTHRLYTLTVSDGHNQARAQFQVSAFEAGFAPSVGDPRTLQVRFSVYGFGLGMPRPAAVYLHYLDPHGHLQASVGLGRTHGVCASVPRTRLRHLFPFHPKPGTWQLQFDTRSSYSSANRPRVVRKLVVR